MAANHHFSQSQKDTLVREGYIVIRNAVPEPVFAAARQLITDALPKDEHQLLLPGKLTTHEAVIALFTQSCLAPLLRNEMGPFPDVISSQIAVIPPHNDLGGKPGPHVDGGWSGPIPEHANEIDPTTHRPYDAARWYGPNDDKRGSNDGQLWIDPDRRISTGSYTCLVGVALNDQLEPGNGQLGVIPRMHEEVEAVFRNQRDSGSVIGAEGIDWPRIKISSTGKPYCNGLPDSIRAEAKRRGADKEPVAGWPWPELTPVCLHKGDAVIALHSCPHTPTPNMGPNPRMNVYFRIRRLREGNPHEGSRRVGHGVNDHPDRGYFGQFLDYPDSYDPWTTSIEKLCDHWSEWDGLQDTVAAMRAAS